MQRLDFCTVPSTLCSPCLISNAEPWSKPLLCMKFLIWVEIGWECIDLVQCLNSPFQMNSGQVCLLQSLAPGCPRCAASLNKYVVGKARLRAVLGRWRGASRGLEGSEAFALVSSRHVSLGQNLQGLGMKHKLRRQWGSVASEKTLMLVGSIYVLWLREQFRRPEPKWGNLQGSSQAVLMLPPVLRRGEKLSKKDLTSPNSHPLPCGQVLGGYHEGPPWVCQLHFPTETRARTRLRAN